MIREHLRRMASLVTATALLAAAPASVWANGNNSKAEATVPTTTPIKHVVVIFQENISFDHYFGTYPYATNPVTETPFYPKDDTPRVNNLLSGGLLTSNPNSVQPFRMGSGHVGHLRSEPQLRSGTKRFRPRFDGPVSPRHRHRHLHVFPVQ